MFLKKYLFCNLLVNLIYKYKLYYERRVVWITKVRYGTNVWREIFYDTLIGTFFFSENLNGDKYLEFLKTELPILLEDIPLSRRKNLVWQKDGAPAHNKNTVIQYLNSTFGKNWMGTFPMFATS